MPAEERVESRRGPLAESFDTLDEAGEFWDTHSSADYEDEMEDVDLDVDLSTRRDDGLESAYQEMAADEGREAEAAEWVQNLANRLCEVSDSESAN